MYKPTAFFKCMSFAFLAALGVQVASASDQALEEGLIDVLSLKPGTTQRVGDSAKALQAYRRRGLVNHEPDQRVDYTDYSLLIAPAKFMGHDLVVIEEEYMSEYVGCCVSPGAGVTVKVVGNTRNLETFASANSCTLTDPVNPTDELNDVGIEADFPAGHYASLSCRERDADR